MNIGVVSDTHRNRELLDKVVERLVERYRIAALYHLGDDYEDVSGLAHEGVEVVQVPGIYHPGYLNGSLPKKITESVLGLRIFLVHSFDKDVTTKDTTVSDIILYGHTHRPEIRLEDGHLFMNPGHLKGHKDKGVDPSFGLLSILDRSVEVRIFSINFKAVNALDIVRSESGLYKA